MKFPVVRTTVSVLDYCWRERKLAMHFGVWPLLIVLVLNVAAVALIGREALSVPEGTMPDEKFFILPLAINLIQMAVYLPLSVTWLRLVVLGEEAARSRSIFTFGPAERRFFGWQIASFFAALAILAIGLGSTYALAMLIEDPTLLSENTKIFLGFLALGWMCIWGAALLVGLMRVTMIFVFAALDQPVSFRAAWTMTAGFTRLLLGATILLALASVAVSLLFKVVGFGVGSLASVITGSEIDLIALAITTLGGCVTSLMFWLTASTLYGLVYKMIVKDVPLPTGT